jgi:hypothetical protein
MWDLWQEMRLGDNRRRTDEVGNQVRRSSGELADLQEQVEKMALVSQALYE